MMGGEGNGDAGVETARTGSADVATRADHPTLLVGVSETENRRLLVDWLSEFYDVTTLASGGSIDGAFDLLVADAETFEEHHEQFVARKGRDDEFLPYLLVTADDPSRLPYAVWTHADEVVAVPARQRELRTCIEGLLDRRRQFAALTRRNTVIEELHEAIRRMDTATDPEHVCEIAVTAASRALDLPVTGIWLADGTKRRLRPVAHTAESESVFETLPTFTAGERSFAWQAFTEGRTLVFDDLEGTVPREGLSSPDTPVRSELVVPLGDHGVLISGSTVERTFDDNDVYGAELLAATTTSALERAEREQALARKSSQLEFFNGLIRHDVLNAMTVIQARADTLAEELEDEHHRRAAQTIQSWSSDVVDVVQRVRSVVETVTGETGSEPEPVSLTEVLADEVETVQTAYPGVDVTMDAPEEVTVLADSLLGDVFGNVLRNAVEHNDPADLAITISVETDSEFATVRFADDGTGVPEERKEEIFRRGETGHVKSTGSGFGLFFVDTMVAEYGGSVRVEDNDPSGAVFVVELPLGGDQ